MQMDEKIKLTKEQYEKLKTYEKHIVSAYKNSYVHMPGNEFLKVKAIYEEITNSFVSNRQMGCNTCRLNVLRKLGELYLNYVPEEDEKKEEITEEPKKKRAPKKKKIEQ